MKVKRGMIIRKNIKNRRFFNLSISQKLKNKKGVSPLISTVLLIMIVIILAIIILLWSRGFIKEAITKEIAGNDKEIGQYCLEVVGKMKSIINADAGETFGFENTGNIPIHAFSLKLVEKDSGSSKVVKISESVNPGFSTIVEDTRVTGYSSYKLIKIIPILLGTSKKSGVTKEFACPEVNGLVI